MKFHLLIVAIAAGAGTFAYLLMDGPHMRDQATVRSWERAAPLPAEGTVPVRPRPALPPADATNPRAGDPDAAQAGRVYYEYYCLACHGNAADGNGPVGESYIPAPADLRTPRVADMADGQLLRASLTGTGHTPVLEKVVPPGHRWPIVTYLRSLALRPTTQPSE